MRGSIHILVSFLVLSISFGCDAPVSKISEELTRQFQASGRSFVNLAEVLPAPWEKVCFLGPFSDRKAVEATLGFHWPGLAKSSIETDRDVALLLFVKGKTVVEFFDHSRRDGDFTNLSRQCISREKAVFEQKNNPPKGYPGLFPKE